MATLTENLSTCQSLDETWQFFSEILKGYGFDHALYAFIPTRPKENPWDGAIEVHNHNPGFLQDFFDTGLAEHDWTIHHCVESTQTQRWNDKELISRLTPKQYEADTIAWDHGLKEGLAVPVRCSVQSGFGGFGLAAGPVPEEEYTRYMDEMEDEIVGLCQCFHAAVLEKQCFNYFHLTTKEKDVLRLLSEGLDKHDIGEALHISSRTSEVHIYRIRDKLGVKTDAHAVAKALIANLVAP